MDWMFIIKIMKKIILTLFHLFLFVTNAMAQNLIIEYNGIGNIKIGSNINNFMNKLIESDSNYISINKPRFGLLNRYNYYFINENYLQIDSIGKAEDIFISTDKSGIILSVIIFIKENNLSQNLVPFVSSVYECEVLKATSGIGNSGENNLMSWVKNSFSFFYRKQYGSKYVKIRMDKRNEIENFSDVNIE
jgi:hypothetical protein